MENEKVGKFSLLVDKRVQFAVFSHLLKKGMFTGSPITGEPGFIDDLDDAVNYLCKKII